MNILEPFSGQSWSHGVRGVCPALEDTAQQFQGVVVLCSNMSVPTSSGEALTLIIKLLAFGIIFNEDVCLFNASVFSY